MVFVFLFQWYLLAGNQKDKPQKEVCFRVFVSVR